MKTYKYSSALFTAIIVLFSVILSSCAKEELVDPPKVILTTDWTNRTEGVVIPSAYTVAINNQELTYSTVSNTLPQLDAGIYPVSIYNAADKITIDGTSAKVSTFGSVVDAKPEYLFYSELDIEFENDKEKVVTAVMQQQVRLLNIELTITDGDIGNIESVSASLSGVANTMNLKDGTYSGTGLKVEPVFAQSGNKLNTSVRLLGLTSEAQELTLDIVYKSGNTQQIVSDVSTLLANFDKDKHLPITLKSEAQIFTVIEVQTTIKAWEVQGTINDNTEIQ